MIDLLLEFLNNGSVSAFLGALSAYLLVKLTDSRRISREHRLVKTQVQVNLALAADKLRAVDRNLDALNHNKVFGSTFMHFSVNEVKSLQMRVLDRMEVNEKNAVDALCYTMSAIDEILDGTAESAEEIRLMKETGADNQERTLVANRIKIGLDDAAANVRRFQAMAGWYLDGDYDRILNTDYRRSDFDPESAKQKVPPGTRPVDEILPREILQENPELAEILGQLSASIDEVVAYGTKLLALWADSLQGGRDEAAPPTLLFRHFLETLDAVARLVASSSIEPSKALLRSTLESFLSLKYLLEKDHEKRSMAFMVWYVHHRLKAQERFDPSTQRGKQYAAKIRGDSIFGQSGAFKGYDTSKHRVRLKTLLSKPTYKAAEQEYTRTVQSGRKNPHWYALYDGPRNIEALANHVGAGGVYEVLYREWSGTVHGTDIFSGKISRSTEGFAQMLALRYPKDAQMVTTVALSLALHIYRLIVGAFLPHQSQMLEQWYVGNVKAFFNRISSGVPLIQIVDEDLSGLTGTQNDDGESATTDPSDS